MTQSLPASIHWRAIMSPVAPLLQLLLTLYTGTPVRPSSYTARCPHVLSP